MYDLVPSILAIKEYEKDPGIKGVLIYCVEAKYPENRAESTSHLSRLNLVKTLPVKFWLSGSKKRVWE